MSTRTARLALILVVLAVSPTRENRAFPGTTIQKHSGDSAQHDKSGFTFEILSDHEGIDFNATLREICLSVKQSWFEHMPPSALLGNEGVNTVEFRILQEGNIPEDSVKMTLRSNKTDLDAASVQAIRKARSVSHLPEKFSQPFIVVRSTFYYNSSPPKP